MNNNPVNNVPPVVTLIVGGLGVLIGFTQPLWVAVVYVVAVFAITYVFLKLRGGVNRN